MTTGVSAEQTESNRPPLVCIGCNNPPEEIEEYKIWANFVETTPDEYVWSEEGTLNIKNGHFTCTGCYLKLGSPTAPFPGWKAP